MSKTTKLTVVFVAALLSAGASMAQNLSRADVIADLQAARASGELAVITAEKGVNGYDAATPAAKAVAAAKPAAPVGKTRAEVIAELKAAVASGELAQMRADAETGNFPSLNRRVPANTMLAGQPESSGK